MVTALIRSYSATLRSRVLWFVRKSFPPALDVNILGHANIDMTQNVPENRWPCASVQPIRLDCMVRKLPKYPLTLGSVGSESLQKVAASVPV
jgi:hypothetical protein